MLTEKELMFGDWVMYNPNVFIEDEYEPAKDCFQRRINSGEEIDLAIEGCYAPIPLTVEILEKNGWVETPTGYVFYTDGKRYDNSLWYIFGDNTFVVNTAEFQIKYVHELQHILRLCGMNDLADNFKI